MRMDSVPENHYSDAQSDLQPFNWDVERKLQLEKRRVRRAQLRASETPSQRALRLAKQRDYYKLTRRETVGSSDLESGSCKRKQVTNSSPLATIQNTRNSILPVTELGDREPKRLCNRQTEHLPSQNQLQKCSDQPEYPSESSVRSSQDIVLNLSASSLVSETHLSSKTCEQDQVYPSLSTPTIDNTVNRVSSVVDSAVRNLEMDSHSQKSQNLTDIRQTQKSTPSESSQDLVLKYTPSPSVLTSQENGESGLSNPIHYKLQTQTIENPRKRLLQGSDSDPKRFCERGVLNHKLDGHPQTTSPLLATIQNTRNSILPVTELGDREPKRLCNRETEHLPSLNQLQECSAQPQYRCESSVGSSQNFVLNLSSSSCVSETHLSSKTCEQDQVHPSLYTPTIDNTVKRVSSVVDSGVRNLEIDSHGKKSQNLTDIRQTQKSTPSESSQDLVLKYTPSPSVLTSQENGESGLSNPIHYKSQTPTIENPRVPLSQGSDSDPKRFCERGVLNHNLDGHPQHRPDVLLPYGMPQDEDTEHSTLNYSPSPSASNILVWRRGNQFFFSLPDRGGIMDAISTVSRPNLSENLPASLPNPVTNFTIPTPINCAQVNGSPVNRTTDPSSPGSEDESQLADLAEEARFNDIYNKAVNSFAEFQCEICTKLCYKSQTVSITVPPKAYLPDSLRAKNKIIVCTRCNTHLKSAKTTHPSKAFWNALDPGPQPEILKSLTQAEIRLLSRIIPFVKIVKLNGRFGQYGFKGQAVLFAQDIHEVTEKLPSMLPRSPSSANILVVTEHLENLDVVREFSICRERVYAALVWLIANNPLYRDVTIDSDVDLSNEAIVRVSEPQADARNIAPQAENDFYKRINDQYKILRSSWNFMDTNMFNHEYAGCQSVSIAVANIVKASVLPPAKWSVCDIDYNLLCGDRLYHHIRELNENLEESIPADNQLQMHHLNVLAPEFQMFGLTFEIKFSMEPTFKITRTGKIGKNDNSVTLHAALASLSGQHGTATIGTVHHTVSVMAFDDQFFLADPQPCGPKGSKARKNIGQACIMACTSVEELERICKRALGAKNKYYNMHIIDVRKKIHDGPNDAPDGHELRVDQHSSNTQRPISQSEFMVLSASSRIIRATTHQGDPEIFLSGYAGVQCTAMVLANFARAVILSPNLWSTDILDENMQFGDSLYSLIRSLSHSSSIEISADGFLNIHNFQVIKHLFSMYDKDFAVSYDDDTHLFGNLQESLNSDGIGMSLCQALTILFSSHKCGILITHSNAYGFMKYNEKYYIFDSHSCDSRGLSTNENGRACLIECDSIADLYHVSVTKLGTGNFEYNLHHMDILLLSGQETHDIHATVMDSQRASPINLCPNQPLLENQLLQQELAGEGTNRDCPAFTLNQPFDRDNSLGPAIQNQIADDTEAPNPANLPMPIENNETDANQATENIFQYVPMQTSLMLPNDVRQPDVEEVFDVDGDLNKIIRKTRDNIVNSDHEGRAEEFAFYNLFPYGINGLKEPTRPVKITPLDYFQYRILGTDSRFTFNEYLFFALSTYEYERVKQTLSACGKKIQGQNGIVDDLHLYLKTLRGSASYWAQALSDLLAMIRLLGEPHYFATFSCNDLHWRDMKKALLIADGRPDVDPDSIDIMETQRLIELYPVILSRHFMVHVHALMKRMNNDPSIFKAKMVDHWWRIEFQNRGSPHLHMVLWLENYPSFDTEEGIRLLDEVITCELPPEDSPIHDIVVKCQIHHHTETCKKNNTPCRFHFPREECLATRIVAHSSDEFIRSGGRICLLKRRKEDRWVNNYNVKLMKMWRGNMDIQPCGSNEAIAYYICKYLSKGEPSQLSAAISEAIRQIRNEDNDISRKLFKICMRILQERQVSAPECAYRLCHLPLRSSSRKCIFLNTRKPDHRYRVIKFNHNDEAIGFCCNIFDRYEKRPHNHPLYNFENMSLLEYAMNFEAYYNKNPNYTEEEPVDDFSENMTEVTRPNRKQLITLTDGQKMIKRNRPAVVRVPYFRISDNAENYYYSLLLQYLPYRSEDELLDGFNSARDAFLAREEQLQQINTIMQLYRKRDQQLENAFNQIHAFDILQEMPVFDEEPEQQVLDAPMEENRFQQGMQSLNMGQRNFIVHVTESVQRQIHGGPERLKIFLTGNAGTGKTMTLNLLEEQLRRCYQRQVVKKCALTGAAAKLTKGSTIHSLLKLPVQRDGKIVNMPMLTGNYLRQMRLIWRDVQFLFIDEISMVPYEMLCMIDSRLRQLKNNERVFFGGINVILFGDLLQLPPVNGSPVFRQPSTMVPATHLWQLFSLVELTENMRQQGSTAFIDILNALRVGAMKEEHFQELMKRANIDQVGKFSLENAIRIYPTNKQVNDHNMKVLNHFREKGTTMYKIIAQDVLIDATRNLRDLTVADVTPTDPNKTGGLRHELEIFVGAKVMLRSNIDVSLGLVNGSIGFITEIIWPYFRRDQVDARDIPCVRIDFGVDGIHVIQPKSIQFPALFNFGTIERRMLPIILSWASTVHKLQGSTVDSAVIYLGPKLFADGQAYVSLSRAQRLEDVCVESLDCSKLTGTKPCNTEALAEMERLRKL